MSTSLYLFLEHSSPGDLPQFAKDNVPAGYSYSSSPRGHKEYIEIPGGIHAPVISCFYAQNYFRIFISEFAVEFYRETDIPSDLAQAERRFYSGIQESYLFQIQRWVETTEGWDDEDLHFVRITAQGTSAGTSPILKTFGYIPPSTSEELLRRYASGERLFTGLGGEEGDFEAAFRNADLRGATFSGSMFADFTKANLANASFLGYIKTSVFHQANLTGASFKAAIDGTDFSDAILDDADFEGSTEQGYFYKKGEKPQHQSRKKL